MLAVTDAFSAAAEPNRRRILQLLAHGPRSVTELAAEFTVTRSAVSQHLAVLAEAGLVEAEQQGRQRLYRVLPSGLPRPRAETARFGTAGGARRVAPAPAVPRPRAGPDHPRRDP